MRKIFKIINYQHFREKAWNGEPYIKRIIKVMGVRTAILEYYDGRRGHAKLYFKIWKWYI